MLAEPPRLRCRSAQPRYGGRVTTVVAESARQSGGQADHRHRRDQRRRAGDDAGPGERRRSRHPGGAQHRTGGAAGPRGSAARPRWSGSTWPTSRRCGRSGPVRRRRRHPDQQCRALTERRTETVDGFEGTIGTNLLGPFAPTNLLYGRVRSQIINVGSDAHKSATLRIDDPQSRSHVDDHGRLRPLEARGHVVGSGPRPAAARGRRAGGDAADAPRLAASNPSHVSDSRLMSLAHWATGGVADRFANDIHEGAAPTFVLHQRADSAGQLCRGERPFRSDRRAGAFIGRLRCATTTWPPDWSSSPRRKPAPALPV